MNKKNILLIGGGGYIGQALYKVLKNNYWTIYTGRKKTFSDPNYRYLSLDNNQSIKKVLQEKEYHFIVILASKIDIKLNNQINLQSLIFKNNFFDFNNFLQKISIYQKQTKLIYISSMTVYDQNSTSPVTEQNLLNPIHSYGLSKVFAEQLFSFYMTHSNNKGVIMRLSGVYGGIRKKGFIFNAITKLRNNRILEIDAQNLGFWETVHIEDLTKMIAKFLKKYKFADSLDTFNFGYGKEIDLIKTAFLIKKILRSKSKIKIKNQNYQRFFLSNKKLSKVINLKNYSFEKSLKKYILETS